MFGMRKLQTFSVRRTGRRKCVNVSTNVSLPEVLLTDRKIVNISTLLSSKMKTRVVRDWRKTEFGN